MIGSGPGTKIHRQFRKFFSGGTGASRAIHIPHKQRAALSFPEIETRRAGGAAYGGESFWLSPSPDREP